MDFLLPLSLIAGVPALVAGALWFSRPGPWRPPPGEREYIVNRFRLSGVLFKDDPSTETELWARQIAKYRIEHEHDRKQASAPGRLPSMIGYREGHDQCGRWGEWYSPIRAGRRA